MSYSFTYTARSAAGEFVAGSLTARSRSEALELLRMRSLVLTSIIPSTTASGTFLTAIVTINVRSAIRTAIFRGLATLTHAGLPLRRSLEIVTEQTPRGAFREALASIAMDIEGGTSLHRALARYPRFFSRTLCAMVHAGEITGTLDNVLEQIAKLLEHTNAVRKRMWAAVTYPAIVAVMAIGLLLFLVGTIVPTMSGLFQSFNRPLPLLTRIVLFAGNSLHGATFWIGCICLCIGIGISFFLASRNDRIATIFELFKYNVPLCGSVLRQAEVSISSRTLGTLLQAGVPLDSALHISAEVVSSRSMRTHLAFVTERARLGQSLAPAFAQSGMYAHHIVALVRAAEEAGTLGEMLLRIAEYTDIEVEAALTALSTLLEPLLMVLIGSIVGVLVAAILIPLYDGIGNLG